MTASTPSDCFSRRGKDPVLVLKFPERVISAVIRVDVEHDNVRACTRYNSHVRVRPLFPPYGYGFRVLS